MKDPGNEVVYGSYNEEQKEENESVAFISVSRRFENLNTPSKSRKRDLLSVYVVLINIWTCLCNDYNYVCVTYDAGELGVRCEQATTLTAVKQ